MSQDNAKDLIDEQELRDALRSLRPNRDTFEAGVRRRIAPATRAVLDNPPVDAASGQSPWLHVAASVIPFSSFAKATVGGSSSSLGTLSFGYKLLAYLALPAVSVFLMLGATLFGFLRIREAQKHPQADGDQLPQQTVAIATWWRQFGLLVGCFLVLALAAIFTGYVMPVFLIFIASTVAMVSLVTRLGRAGLIDRRAIGGNLMMGLVLLTQVTQIYTSTNAGVHLLDQSLVQALLLGAGAAIGVLLSFTIRNRWLAALAAIHAVGFGLIIVGFFARSLWAPVTTETLESYVESFDDVPVNSAGWHYWEVPAVWLQESGIPLDLSVPRKLLKAEIAGEQNPFILGVGFAANLVEPADLPHLQDLEATKERLVNEALRDRPIPSLEQRDYAIRALVALDDLTPLDRDVLESRLLATLCDVEAEYYQPRSEALTATRLLEVLGRPCDDKAIAALMQRVIVEFQRTRFRSGVRAGGFASSRQHDFSDAMTTAAVVELLEIYGIPDDLDLMALRSYLRPSTSDRQMMLQSALRVATKQRLESIPGVPPVRWRDYIRHEQTLWMALMVAILCFYATLGSAVRVPEVDEHAKSDSQSHVPHGILGSFGPTTAT